MNEPAVDRDVGCVVGTGTEYLLYFVIGIAEVLVNRTDEQERDVLYGICLYSILRISILEKWFGLQGFLP